MSGPKDFVFVFAAARLAGMLARRAALQAARQAEVQSRREATRKRMQSLHKEAAMRRAASAEKALRAAEKRFRTLAQQRASAEKKAAAADGNQSPEVAAQRFDRLMSAAREELMRLDNALDLQGDPSRSAIEEELEGLATAKHDSETLHQAEQLCARLTDTVANVETSCEQLREMMVTLHTWDEQLSKDDAVFQFAANAAQAWRDKTAAFLALKPGIESIADMVTHGRTLCDEAEQLYSAAGEQKSRFDERNELLGDILSSLQEIGFFVSDPEYENPNDPAGPVIVKATRGSEEMSASIDLSDTVRTVWNGLTDEKCKDSFFQYIEQMAQKDVEIKATRPDLQSRPILRQAGARDLPRSTSRGEGG